MAAGVVAIAAFPAPASWNRCFVSGVLPLMGVPVKYLAVRSDGSRVQHGDQIGYVTYPGYTVPAWFEFAAGTQNLDRYGEAGGSGGQIVIRYERYGQMVKPLRAGSDFGLTVYSVFDPRVADLIAEDELEHDTRDQNDPAPGGQRSSRMLGIKRIPVPPHLLG
jgi:hypothetical protein